MTAYIDGVDSTKLAEVKATRELDPGAKALIAAEQVYIKNRRIREGFDENPPLSLGLKHPKTAALALSGGGIRSAAFALGVMQKLAGEDYLRLFDYLSTVSGGGYIGSSLTWLTSSKFKEKSGGVRFGVHPGGPDAPLPFPYGTNSIAEPPSRHPPCLEDQFLTYLRSHGQYLIPGGGITIVSGIAVILRGILVNLLVWLPIAAFLAVLLDRIPLGKLAPWAGEHGLFCLDQPPTDCAAGVGHLFLPPGFAWVLAAAVFFWAAFVIGSIVYSFSTVRKNSPAALRYRGRRFFEKCAHWVLLWAVGLTVIGTLPWVAGAVHQWIGNKGGFGFLVSGAAGGVVSFFKSRSSKEGKIPLALLAPIAGLLFCYGFLILAFDIGWRADVATSTSFALWPPQAWDRHLLYPACLLLAIALGFFVNLNYLTIHRYYRDRLMEAFMPDIALVQANRAGPARAADPAPLSTMCDDEDPRGPYHIINTNLILTGTKDKTRRTRGGDSFILSPRYCGSNATGWRATDKFIGNEITLPTAMAISGAAINPDAGTGGVGVTRNPIVSIVLSLLNLRLGYWVPSPQREWRSLRPNHFEPGLLDLVDWDRDEKSSMLRLSDGGHFDNLGIYEMIRRRVEFIVVSDAGADPDFSFSDLTNALARAEQDFGARIVFDDVPALSPLMPSQVLPFPREFHRSKRGYAKATITYSDRMTGTLLYLTTTIIDGLRLQLLGYLGANPTFPDETTADQFFSEAQFEAYRELGYLIAEQMLDGTRDATDSPDHHPGYRDEFSERLMRFGV